MRLKPKSTVFNPRALVYKRFIGLEQSLNITTVYNTVSDGKVWAFDNQLLQFIELDYDIPDANLVQVTDATTVLGYQGNYFKYMDTTTGWVKVEDIVAGASLLSATFNNIARYQTNKYYFSGSFDYMIKGSESISTTQFIKGNITPLRSFNIKYYSDDIKLTPDDLVVIGSNLYSVESCEVVRKMLPRPFNIYFATLNSIL
mgnify:CR=1 FL=1